MGNNGKHLYTLIPPTTAGRPYGYHFKNLAPIPIETVLKN